MGKLVLGPKDQLDAPKQPAKARIAAPKVDAAPQYKQVAAERIERQVELIEKPVYITKEVIVEVPVIKEIIVERVEQVPIIQEVIKEIRVEVPVEVIKEVERVVEKEKIVKIPVITRVKYVPKWVNYLFWFEIVKYIGLAYWLMVK